MGTHTIPKNAAGPEDLVTPALGLQKVRLKRDAPCGGVGGTGALEGGGKKIRGLEKERTLGCSELSELQFVLL